MNARPTYASAALWALIGVAAALTLAGASPWLRIGLLVFCLFVAGYAVGRRHAELRFQAALDAAVAEDQAGQEVVEHDQFDNGASCLTTIHSGVDGEGYEWHTVALGPDREVAATRIAYDQSDALRNHKGLSAKVG